MKRLSPSIISYLSGKLGISPNTVRKNVSLLRREHTTCTLNAVAHIYAMQKGRSVLQKLDDEDRKSVPNNLIREDTSRVTKQTPRPREKMLELIKYETSNYFKMAHIEEINKAYTTGCLTSANILVRKVIENLIIDILRKKYPANVVINKELYYDTKKGRYKDFSVILRNLYDKRTDFQVNDQKIIERLYNKTLKIKEDANDKTHSWYYIVTRRSEIDDLDIQMVVELILELERSIGTRR